MSIREMEMIRDQWHKPRPWNVETDDQSINVLDEDGDRVVSSILHSHLESVVEEHIEKAQIEVAIQLLIPESDETEM